MTTEWQLLLGVAPGVVALTLAYVPLPFPKAVGDTVPPPRRKRTRQDRERRKANKTRRKRLIGGRNRRRWPR